MKTLKTLVFCLSIICFYSCDKNESEDLNNVSVERYIELLKEGKYESLELPEFTSKDIPELLKSRNDNLMIMNFPINGISSLSLTECKLGMYVLWTIESIRSVAINSESLIGRFPSQNPILALRNSAELDLVYDDESQETAAKAYFDWWEENKDKEFDEFKNIDPLIETEYWWH